jgi:putative tryptophan/tyrosine transport system substrate-binding protein
VRLHVDVIVVNTKSLTRAAQQATTTIPIVMSSVDDPVAEGFIASLAHPGGNITGVDNSLVPEMSGKLLEFLKEAVPAVSRIAVLVHLAVASAHTGWGGAYIAFTRARCGHHRRPRT